MSRIQRSVIALTLALSIAGFGMFALPSVARAEESLEELQQRVEEATASYNDAIAQSAAVEEQMVAKQAEIDAIEAQLPEQRTRAAESLRALYKLHQSGNGLVELVLSAEDFNEFLSTIQYLDRIQSRNTAELTSLKNLEAELQEAKDLLSAEKALADQLVVQAEEARNDAMEARAEAQRRAMERAAAEAAAAQAAIEAARAKADQTFVTAGGNTATVDVPAEGAAGQVPADAASQPEQEQPAAEQTPQHTQIETINERDAFINTWAPRIDNYLAGSPLGGYGRTFAEAAWDYNVDPRWSPAISCIESSKGVACFRPHNAWGWGNSSWSSWDEAIRDHVAGLARGYGYTITPSAAQKYCPPTWAEWYSSVLSQMSLMNG